MTPQPTVCSWCRQHRHHACPGQVLAADGEFPCACSCQDVSDDGMEYSSAAADALDETPDDDEPARAVEDRT